MVIALAFSLTTVKADDNIDKVSEIVKEFATVGPILAKALKSKELRATADAIQTISETIG